MAMLSAVIAEVRESFSSDYIHLGYDERNEGRACYKEADIAGLDYDIFERKVNKLMEVYKIPLEKVIRWENAEGKVYPGRTGKLTHYRLQDPPTTGNSDPYFVSTNLEMMDLDSKLQNAWDVYSQTKRFVVSDGTKPTAVLASVGSLTQYNWDEFSIGERLLAMTMALRKTTSSIKIKDDFRRAFDAEWKLRTSKDDNNFGVIKDPTSARNRLEVAAKDRLEKNCRVKTRQIERLFPIKGVLVPLDGDLAAEEEENSEEERALLRGNATISNGRLL
jgi:hypothetical protein